MCVWCDGFVCGGCECDVDDYEWEYEFVDVDDCGEVGGVVGGVEF